MGLIYKITHKVSGKGYTGQTIRDFETRMKQHKAAADNLNKKDGCRYLNNAIREHGWDNFTKEIIFDNCPDDELDAMETKLIAELNTLYPNGYNLTTGGNSKKQYSEATIEKMRQGALEREGSGYRKKDITKDWPKHLGLYLGYPRITKHPNCSSLPFNDKNKTFDENLKEAMEYLDKLNKGVVKHVQPERKLPEGVHKQHAYGYRVVYVTKAKQKITKLFTRKSITEDELEKQAIAYLEQLIAHDVHIEQMLANIPNEQK